MASPDRMEVSREDRRTRNVHGDIAFAFAIALVFFLAYLMREILLMIYISALFAVVLKPVVRSVTRLRIGKWHPNQAVAIVLLIAAVAGAATLFISFALPPVIHDLTSFSKELPSRGPTMLERFRKLPLMSHINIAALNSKIQGFASNIAEYLIFSISTWASKLADIVMVLVLTIYFMLEGDLAYRWALSLFPRHMRERLDGTLRRAEVRMGKWLLGQGTLMLILGVSSTIVFLLLKIRYAYALGVVMGVLNIIPVIGGLFSMVMVVIVAAIDSWGKVAGALIFYAVYAQFETSYLTPRVMRSSVNLVGLAVLISLLMGSKLAGVVGAMIAVPTAVLAAVLIEEYVVRDDAKPELDQ